MECYMDQGNADQKIRYGFSALEKEEVWDRWARGESLKAIGRAFGKQSSGIVTLTRLVFDGDPEVASADARYFL